MPFFKKISPRRSKVRENISADRFSRLSRLVSTEVIVSILLWLLFVVLSVPILSFEAIRHLRYFDLLLISAIVVLISLAVALYVYQYQKRIIRNHVRAVALVGLFIVLLAATKVGALLSYHTSWATGTAVTAAIILAIAYDQRFAVGMSVFYMLLATLAVGPLTGDMGAAEEYQLININLLLTMAAGVVPCCFCLKEIRTRMKLLNVGALAAVMVFITALAVSFLGTESRTTKVFSNAGCHAGAAFLVALLIQSLLPLIEKAFRIATSMTLLGYSDANQPLLRRLAMEAPGTFSHSLVIGSIAEAAAESIGRNGLLCRVGAYYHDIGKINKPGYFVENEMGSVSRHKELSPAMSQLVIVGHVKDGVEMAREYGLPTVIRQFIETHHGTTLVEPFYNEAKKKADAPASGGTGRKPRQAPPSESEFRYAGPKPRTKEAAIVMLADAVEGAVRSLPEVTPTKIEIVVHNIAMKRLQDGQFDQCDISLRELSQIETSISKSLAAHYHGRIAYPKSPDEVEGTEAQPDTVER